MSKYKPAPDLDLLSKHLRLDLETGQLFRRVKTSNSVKVGALVGSPTRCGYLMVCVQNQKHLAHRLVWVLRYGVWPEHQIDHINGDRSDNRPDNLRLATNQENQMNRKLSCSNKSGFKGVCWNEAGGNWRSYITVNRKRIHLGVYKELADAAESYEKAAIYYFGEFARVK